MSYDGRATGVDTGIAAHIDPKSGGNDPTMTAVNGAYTAMWNSYLNDQLLFTSNVGVHRPERPGVRRTGISATSTRPARSSGVDSNGNVVLYTAGDLAATMSLNVDLKVFSANGYYDSVTPFHQTALDLQNMPLGDAELRRNLTIRYYPSGHMIYLDGGSRTAMKADLGDVLRQHRVRPRGGGAGPRVAGAAASSLSPARRPGEEDGGADLFAAMTGATTGGPCG